MRVAWVTTWSRVCGIATYSQALWPAVLAALEEEGGSGDLISLDEFRSSSEVSGRIRELRPDLVHFQHEYGIWGGKNPPGYWFPEIVRILRQNASPPKLVATAHTVLSPQYRFPLSGRGIQIPFRALANLTLLKHLRRLWGVKTWGRLDAIVVHSALQKAVVEMAQEQNTTQAVVKVIPHFVPVTSRADSQPAQHSLLARIPTGAPVVAVFGFFSHEKGQDIAIEMLAHLPPEWHLLLAGGVRRADDQAFYDRCVARARALGLGERVIVTGYVEDQYIDSIYDRAQVVLAPFRESTGSGSLAQALARWMPIVASDLALNRELSERVPGALKYFRAGDPQDCARQVRDLLSNPSSLTELQHAAREYAERFKPARIATRHLDLYRELL